ncbi:conserved hypothetical protein [Ricinus communis]|uniref:Uncharacterized protein n=1 Tax=Ricinus communis TaxID=3988 RepID=B9S9X0_RICCO|nr:conserved hypothetical protein [Ricinus communis]
MNKFFGYRTNQLNVTQVSAQIVVLPLGKFMDAVLPKKQVKLPFTKRTFSLNPGPLNLKEHALITIFAGCGANSVYAVHMLTSVMAFYRRPRHPVVAMLLVQTTQLLGYGWAGMFRKILVDSPYMWPVNLVQVSLFRALHEKEKRPRRGLTKLQFFTIKDSIPAQQIGTGLSGFGIGSFGLDKATVASFLGSPLNPFASLMATLSHVALFDGKTIWRTWTKARGAVKDQFTDIHTRIMKKNYEAVPE